MWGKKKAVEEPVDEVWIPTFDDLHSELDDIVETAEQPEAEVPEDFEARVNELTELLREAQERAAAAKLAAASEGLSPFKTPFASKPASVVERPRSLNRRITRVEVEAGESRIVSQFEDNEPEEKKVYPAVWNLGYRLEELAAAVAGILVDPDTGDIAHEHEEYAAADHTHDAQDLTHDHDDYFPKGSAADDDGNPLPLPYGDAMELGGAVDDVKEENGEQNDRLDVLEAAPTVAIGDNPPSDEKSKDGDLWWDSVRMEMFIRYQDAWITTNALSARVEAGEQVQAELLARVAVGEEQQVILQDKVRALEGAVGEHPFQFLTNNSPRPGQFVMIDRNGQPTGTVADVLYLMFPTTDHNNDDVDMGRLVEGDLLRLSSPNGGIVEFKSGADANSDSFLVDSVVRADFDTLFDGVVYGATYLSQFDPSGLATIVYVDTVTGTLKQETKDYVDDEIGKIDTSSLSVAQHAINCQPPGVEFRYQEGSSGLSAHNFQLWESGGDKRIRISSSGYHVDWLDSGIVQDYSMNNGPYFSIYFQPSIASTSDRVKWRQRWHGRVSRIDWHENDILLHVSSWYSNGSLSPGSVYFITIGGIL